MSRPVLILMFLWLVAFSLAVDLEPRHRFILAASGRPTDALSILLGDSRRLFAQHMYAKADAYFHSGYYPTIFDNKPEELHLSASASAGGSAHAEAVDWLGAPKDWLDRFSRNFYPSEHRHLGAAHDAEEAHAHDEHHGHEHGEDHNHEHAAHEHAEPKPGDEQELLPWLRLAATLDSGRPETYVVASYWLRSHLNKVTEAERFLREGLRSNPGHPELLFELGRIHREHHGDNDLARNIWEAALTNWLKRAPQKQEENRLLTAQLYGNLAKLEEETGRYDRALGYLRSLAAISPNKTQIEAWIAELEARSSSGVQ